MKLKELLSGELSKSEMKTAPRSFDIIGSKERAVAVIEIDERLKRREKIIAKLLMSLHKNVKSVLGKSPRRGTYRIMRTRLIYGSKNTAVTHRENGCLLKLDPRKVYFSPREGTERMRIARMVSEGEHVMVFFAGAGPFAVVIGKKSHPKKITGIEINPAGARYFRENVKLNKLENIEAVKGDVRKLAKKYYGSCDRVIMPLPETAIKHVKEAVLCLKSGGVCHLYCFSSEDEQKVVENKILHTAEKLGKKARIIGAQKVLPWGPDIWKMRIDFRLGELD